MATGSLKKRLEALEAAAGLTEPDRIHIILTDFCVLGPPIPEQRIQRPGQPDLIITTTRELAEDDPRPPRPSPRRARR